MGARPHAYINCLGQVSLWRLWLWRWSRLSRLRRHDRLHVGARRDERNVGLMLDLSAFGISHDNSHVIEQQAGGTIKLDA